jgi:hypothetical protein
MIRGLPEGYPITPADTILETPGGLATPPTVHRIQIDRHGGFGALSKAGA